MLAAILFAGLCAADAPKLEDKLHGEWRGGACQGTFTFNADGTYQLKQWSPGNHALSGTWAMRWDALPPTLVLTCKDSGRKEYVGTAWKMKVTELDGESLSLLFNSPKEGDGTIRYTRVNKLPDAKKPGETPSDYIKVELRGKLRVTERQEGATFDVEELAGQPVNATIHHLPLAFGGSKEFAALAKTLDGKTVLVSGNLTRAPAERTAVKPTHYVSYVKVTALKAAGEPADGKSKVDADQSADGVTTGAEADALLKGVVVTGTLKQVIGGFGSPGRPEVGDSFELDFGKLPQEMLKLTPQTPNRGPHYIPSSAPLKLERVKQGKGVSKPTPTVIHLSAIDTNGKFLIQVIAEDLKKGSKVRVYIFKDGGFLGNMAEAEGVLK